MRKAKDERRKSKAANEKTIEDARLAKSSLEEAEEALTKFYKESGAMKKEPWEFLQEQEGSRQQQQEEDDESAPTQLTPEATNDFGSSDTQADPMADGGIIKLLKDTAADYILMDTQTTAAEKVDQDAYQKLVSASKIDDAEKSQDLEMKKNQQERLE